MCWLLGIHLGQEHQASFPLETYILLGKTNLKQLSTTHLIMVMVSAKKAKCWVLRDKRGIWSSVFLGKAFQGIWGRVGVKARVGWGKPGREVVSGEKTTVCRRKAGSNWTLSHWGCSRRQDKIGEAGRGSHRLN